MADEFLSPDEFGYVGARNFEDRISTQCLSLFSKRVWLAFDN
jgi:hypothetical protein